jgi:hypothetical protein
LAEMVPILLQILAVADKEGLELLDIMEEML